jgi:hypothetical protein
MYLIKKINKKVGWPGKNLKISDETSSQDPVKIS